MELARIRVTSLDDTTRTNLYEKNISQKLPLSEYAEKSTLVL